MGIQIVELKLIQQFIIKKLSTAGTVKSNEKQHNSTSNKSTI